MTLDQFRYFLEVSKFEHLGKASKALHISPSAVSSAISQLEEELNCRLFHREGKGIQLTDKGRQLRTQLEQLFDKVGEIQLAMSEKEATISGTYRIAASPFLATHFLGPACAKLQKEFPQVSFEIVSIATAHVVSGVLSGSFDGGLCFSPLRHPDLQARELYRGNLDILVRKGHPVLKSAKDQLQQLSDYPAAIHKASPGVDLCEDHPMFGKFGIKTKNQVLWDSDDVAVEVLHNSDFWAMMPDVVSRVHKRTIQPIATPKGWQAPYEISLVVRSHRGNNSFLKVLEECLQKSLN
ncbi:MAG: LysR substrate-binding domain-containing protein [Bdellovibrionota bacterium]